MSVSPRRLLNEMSKVDQLRAELAVGNTPDPKLLIDTIEGQTQAFEYLDAYVESVIADEALAAAAKAKAKRLEARADVHRATVLAIMEKVGIRRADRPVYTASVAHRAKLQVIDEARIPFAYQRISLDKLALAAALRKGEKIEGAVLSNPAPILSIRIDRKGAPQEEEEPDA